jgi:hypothetical protein
LGLIECNKTWRVHIMKHWGAFGQTLCSGKTISVTCSECVFLALGVQYAICMGLIVLSSVACPVVQYDICPHYLIKDKFFEKKKNLRGMFWFSLQSFSETFLIPRRNERNMIKNVYWPSCKVPVILDRFWWNSNFLNRIYKRHSDVKFYENLPSGSPVFVCGRTDIYDEANRRFTQFFARA